MGWWGLLLILLLLLGGEDVPDDALNTGFAEGVCAGGEPAGFVEVLEADGADPRILWGVFYLGDLTE